METSTCVKVRKRGGTAIRGNKVFLQSEINTYILVHTFLPLTKQRSSSFKQMAKLSSEYYHLVPQEGYAYEKIKPIENARILRQQQGILHNLLEYEMIAKILAGAQFRIKGLFLYYLFVCSHMEHIIL